MSGDSSSLSVVVATGLTTLAFGSGLAYVLLNRGSGKGNVAVKEEVVEEEFDQEKYPGGHLSIYYASQTGTAESFARIIEREGPEHGFFVHVIDLEDIEMDGLKDEARRDPNTGVSKAVFLVSTYGEGEPTDNSAAFVMELKNRSGMASSTEEEKKESEPITPEPSLEGVEYSVFGLGNRQYEHFNAMGRLFNDSLGMIGAKRIIDIGLGDDDDDLEADFENWKDNIFWPKLKECYVKDVGIPTISHADGELPSCPYQVEFLDREAKRMPIHIPLENANSSSRHYFESYDCPVPVVRELRTKEDPGSTVHVEIDISKAKDLTYFTADNLGVLPMNDSDVVESVAKSLGYDLDDVFVVKNASSQDDGPVALFPMPLTVRECLTKYCDLTGAPRRSELKRLAEYAKDPMDKKALMRMSSKESKAEYREKIVDAHAGLVDIFRLCPSIEAPLEHFLDFCPKLVPRYYTISSSSSVYPKTVHLTVSVTETTKKDGSIFKGLCSNHIASVKPRRGTLRVFNRSSSFRLPQDSSCPIIMIGPGTGVAPMRAFLQEREYQKKRKQKVGKNILYFGCKKQSMDFIYEKEMDGYKKRGILDELHVALSREQKEKVYVQHLLAKNAKETWSLLQNEGAFVFVCGGTKMGHDVSETLESICKEEGNLSADDAKDYLDKMSSAGRYVQELWA